MNHDMTGHWHNVYRCKSCGSVQNEEDLVAVKIDGYYRLYCCFCNSKDIENLMKYDKNEIDRQAEREAEALHKQGRRANFNEYRQNLVSNRICNRNKLDKLFIRRQNDY